MGERGRHVVEDQAELDIGGRRLRGSPLEATRQMGAGKVLGGEGERRRPAVELAEAAVLGDELPRQPERSRVERERLFDARDVDDDPAEPPWLGAVVDSVLWVSPLIG